MPDDVLPDAIDLKSLRRVLVIKLRHHGDVLLTSPVFTVLKNRAPHLEIDALVYRDTQDMLTLHPAIDRIHSIDRDWKSRGLFAQARAERRLIADLRGRQFDLVIHLTEHRRGAWLKRMTGARYGLARRVSQRGWFWRTSFSHFFAAPPPGVKRHTVEVHLDALRRIGTHARPEERRLVLVPGDAADARIEALLAEHQLAAQGFIHIHPTSRWFFKTWPPEKMASLIAALAGAGERLVLTAAPEPRELALIEKIMAHMEQPVVNLAGQLSLKELAALTARARLFIGVDSVPMHIAAAMGTPTVAIFGPSGEWEWGPWQVAHRLVMSDMVCRPCGQDGCGGGKVSECLTSLPVSQVLEAARALLAS
jgi:heptosyltransferase-3